MRRLIALLLVASLSVATLPLATDGARAAGASEARIFLGEPTTLDPAAASDSTSSGVIVQLFERLTALDSGLVVRPALAERWELLDGGRRIVFTMREGLTFSDGTPLIAADVVRSWLRLLDPRSPGPFATFLLDVEGARAYVSGQATDPASVGLVADGRTLEVRFTRPAGDFPAVAASASLAVVPPDVGSDPGALDAGPGFVASGGYRLVGRDAAELRLEANPRYWAGTPAIATIIGVASLGGRSPVDMFTAGELDWTPIGSYDADWISYDDALGPSLRRSNSFTTFYYGFDTAEAPFDDARVRRAFAQAVDWRRVVALADGAHAVPATGMVPAGLPGRSEEDFLPAFDPEAAAALLAEAGYPGGAGFPEVTLVTAGGYDSGVIAQLEQNLGVRIAYEGMDFEDYFPRLYDDPPDMWSLSWMADYPGPNDFLGVLLGGGESNNYGRWTNDSFDAAIDRALATADPAAARAAFDEAERIVRDEAPVVPVSYGTEWSLAREGLLGAVDNGSGDLRLAGLAWQGGGRP
ncbi:MAG: peptide ABC transporter substrate-binding protein [Chloroflexi bacterium]|nr:peptide ABC transporter substrate-binding protein [Chloroflexota bacterium]